MRISAAVALVALAASGCAADHPSHSASAARATASPSPTPDRSDQYTKAAPCDPGGGRPRASEACPDQTPITGWLTVTGSAAQLEPFLTYGNDAEGRAYAKQHGVDFPFPNDYLDVAAGDIRPVFLSAQTQCTGIIRVDYRDPLEDHAVDCNLLTAAASAAPLAVAVWTDGDRIIQISELYRP